MAYFRCGGGGVPASVKTDMNAVLNKKFGTSTDYPPADWAPTVNLMGPLPEKTQASAPVCSFDDGADDVPTKSLVVTIPPTLTGASSVTETQTGANQWNGQWENGSINNTTGQDANLGTNRIRSIGYIPVRPSTIYALVNPETVKVYPYFYRSDYTYISVQTTNLSIFTTPSDCYYVRFRSDDNYGDPTGKISINYPSTVTTYEPYTAPTQYTASLGRTIYGGQADIVNGTGKETYAEISDFSTLRANGTSTSGAYRYIMDVLGMGDYNVGACISTPNLLNYRVSWNADVGEFYNTANVLVIFLSQDNATDAINYLTSNSCKVAYPLATPTDFTFDGQEIPTRLGYNAFWSDEGDTEVTYRADIDLLLGGN